MALTTVQSGMMDSVAQYNGFKNRIINGAMQIDQRNAGALNTNANGYITDRFYVAQTTNGKLNAQQNLNSVTPPAGFTNYLGVTVVSAYSVTSSDIYYINQPIEGYNTADFAFGTASAATVTLSFWVRSSLTGTFGVRLINSAGNRSYVATYNISSANTWEQKSVTIPGDTTGTWIGATNGIGIQVLWTLAAGSNFQSTANSWQNGNYTTTSAQTQLVGTNGATFYITGVQLEKGVTATSFDCRPITTELQLCQRYYEKTYAQGVAPGTAGVVGYNTNGGLTNLNTAAHGCRGYSSFRVIKRATPTVVCYDTLGNNGKVNFPDTTANVTIGYQDQVDSGFIVEAASASSADGRMYWHWTATAEL